MIPMKRSLSLALGLVVLATVAVLITTGTVGASPRLTSINAAPPTPSIPVNVTNTPLAVSIAGTPTVNANIGGTVNANLTNSSITVGNPATNPVLVRDVDNPANNTFESYVCRSGGSYAGNCSPGSDTVTIPTATNSGAPAKMLVIDNVSGTCSAAPGGEIINVQFDIPYGGYAHFLVPITTFSSGSEIDYAFAQETRLYAAPGQPVTVGTQRHTGSPDYYCLLQFTGHFVTQ
jgi:hypothetical protein